MDPFVIKWLLSLVVGATWVAIAVTIAEKVSGKLGGLILGLPATPVVSLLFIGLTQGMSAASITALGTVYSTGLYSFFFLSYLLLAKRNFWLGVIGSIVVWLSFAFFAGKIHPTDIAPAIIVWAILMTVSITYAVKKLPIDMSQITPIIIKTPLWFKAGLSGLVISLVVLISRIAGPIWGGIFATFPSFTLPTILMTRKSGGIEFTRLIVKNVLISSITTIGLFAILSYFLMPPLGLFFGIIAAYVILLTISLPLYFLVFEKLKD